MVCVLPGCCLPYFALISPFQCLLFVSQPPSFILFSGAAVNSPVNDSYYLVMFFCEFVIFWNFTLYSTVFFFSIIRLFFYCFLLISVVYAFLYSLVRSILLFFLNCSFVFYCFLLILRYYRLFFAFFLLPCPFYSPVFSQFIVCFFIVFC